MVGFKSQAFIGLDGIEPSVLQRVRLQLRHQADSAAFLLLIDQDACALLANHGERHLQLLAAVTAQRAENVARETLGVDAYQRGTCVDIPHDKGHGFFLAPRVAGFTFKAEDLEISPARWEICGRELANS